MAHDERVSSQDLNMLRRQRGGVRRQARGTQRLSSCMLRCLSKLKKSLGLYFSFFTQWDQALPSTGVQHAMLFPFPPSVSVLTFTLHAAEETQTALGRLHPSVCFDF